jgi:transcriptional regulator with XRE-family HTH domain
MDTLRPYDKGSFFAPSGEFVFNIEYSIKSEFVKKKSLSLCTLMKKLISLPNLNEIGKRICSIRKSLGLSQKEFAKRYELKNYQNVSRYENGITEPPLALLLKLSRDALVSVDWILTGEKPEKIGEVSDSKEFHPQVKEEAEDPEKYRHLIEKAKQMIAEVQEILPELERIMNKVRKPNLKENPPSEGKKEK